MQVWNVLHAARWKYRMQKIAKNSPLRTFAQICRAVSSQLRQVSIIGKKIVKPQYLLQMSQQSGELRPISGWDRFTSLGHPSKFQRVSRDGFVTAQTSLNAGQPNFAHDVWPSPALVHYIYIFGGSCPLTEFYKVQNSLASNSCVLLYWQRYCTELQ